MERSAEATSGRRWSRSEGSPTGIAGSDAVDCPAGMVKLRRRCPDQRRDGMLELRPLVVQEFELRGSGVNQGLLLRQIQTRRESKVVPRADESQSVALQFQAVAHHRDFRIEFAQCEIVGHQLRRQEQTRVLEVRFRLLRGGARALDFAAHPAEQVGLVIHARAQHEIVLHSRLIGHGVSGQRAVRRRLAAVRRGGQSDLGV